MYAKSIKSSLHFVMWSLYALAMQALMFTRFKATVYFISQNVTLLSRGMNLTKQ